MQMSRVTAAMIHDMMNMNTRTMIYNVDGKRAVLGGVGAGKRAMFNRFGDSRTR